MITQFEIEYIKYHFPWEEFGHVFFNAELKDDYLSQKKRICEWFDLNSVLEYDTIIEGNKELKSDLNTFSKN